MQNIMKPYRVQIIKSKRKTIAIQIDRELNLIVRAPKQMRNEQIERFVASHADWIEKNMAKMEQRQKERQAEPEEHLSDLELNRLRQDAAQWIPPRVQYWADIVGVDYGRITIRNQRTRWGSCSSKGNLNFNCLLMLTPPEIIDYVIVHELCHRKEMNHSKAFWKQVETILPDYKNRVKWLKLNGDKIIQRRENAG